MLDALKALFENNAISEEIRAEIEQAWESKIKENRLSATAELREEFAQKYAQVDREMKPTEKTKSMWYPKLEITKNSLLRWIEDDKS